MADQSRNRDNSPWQGQGEAKKPDPAKTPPPALAPDPLDAVVASERVCNIKVDDFNESEMAQNPLEKLLPKTINGVGAVVYRFWHPVYAVEDPLFPHAHAVSADGDPPFAGLGIPRSMFAGSGVNEHYRQGQVPGCLYYGLDTQVFWVPLKVVKQLYRAAMRDTEAKVDQLRGRQVQQIDPSSRGSHGGNVSTVTSEPLAHFTEEITGG